MPRSCFTLLSAATLEDDLIEQMSFFFFFLISLYHEKAHLPFNFYLIVLAVFCLSLSPVCPHPTYTGILCGQRICFSISVRYNKCQVNTLHISCAI